MDPSLAADVITFVADNDAVGQDLLAAWAANGTALLAQLDAHDFGSLSGWVGRNGITVEGKTVTVAQYDTAATLVFDHLWLKCGAPPANWRPLTADPALKPPTATLVYVANQDSVVQARLSTVGVGSPTPIHLGDGETYPSFSPDGTRLAWQDGRTLWTSAANGADAHPIDSTTEMDCPAWAPDPAHLVVSRRATAGAWQLAIIDAATGASAEITAPVPFRQAPCAAYLNASTLIVTTTNAARHVVTVTMPAAGGPTRPFVTAPAGCNVGQATPSPDGHAVLLNLGCNDPYLSGIWVAPGSGAAMHQIISGHVGTPIWGPDGTTVLFGYIAIGAPTSQPQLWMATTDGGKAEELEPAWASWPAINTHDDRAFSTVAEIQPHRTGT